MRNVGTENDVLYRLADLLDTLCPPRRAVRRKYSSYDVLQTIQFLLSTGLAWNKYKDVSKKDGTAAFRRFKTWVVTGTLEKAWGVLVDAYITRQKKDDVKWFHQVFVDTSYVKSINGLKGEQDLGRNPTDRGKTGMKVSIVCDQKQVPLSISFHEPKTHDSHTIENTIHGLHHQDLRVDKRYTTQLIADRGYDSAPKKKFLKYRYDVRLVTERVRRGRNPIKQNKKKRYEPARLSRFDKSGLRRRHCVENCFCRLDKFRRLLLRYDKTTAVFLGFHLAAFCMCTLHLLLF